MLLARYSQSESIEVQTASLDDVDTVHIDKDAINFGTNGDYGTIRSIGRLCSSRNPDYNIRNLFHKR